MECPRDYLTNFIIAECLSKNECLRVHHCAHDLGTRGLFAGEGIRALCTEVAVMNRMSYELLRRVE